MPQPDRPGTPGYGEDGKEKERDRKTVETKVWRMILDDRELEIIADKLAPLLVDKVLKLIEDMKPKYYNRKEVCRLIDVSEPTLRRYDLNGKLKPKRIGGRVLYDVDAIDKAVKEKTFFRNKKHENRSTMDSERQRHQA